MSTPLSPPPPLRLLRDFPDWHSPMVVKEMRHGLRTRFFTSAILLLHGLLALLMSSGLAGADPKTIGYIFWTLTMILLLGVMPLRGFGTLNSESKGGTMDMLTLTNISSFRIVYGKWMALFSQTLLVASSLLPYMVARYHFGGVELPREVMALAILVLASALSTAALVGFSSQKSVLLRLLLLTGVGILSFALAILVMVSLVESFGSDVMSSFVALPVSDQLSVTAGLLLLTGYGIYLFLSLGASRVAPPSENHSTLKRVVALVALAILSVTGCCLVFFHSDNDAGVWALFPAVIITLILGVDVMTEAMPRFPTVVAAFAQRGTMGRLAGRCLYPGWASGVIFYIALWIFPVAIFAAISWKYHSSSVWEDSAISMFWCLLTAAVVPVCVRLYQSNRFGHWWVTQLGLLAWGLLILMLMDATRLEGLSVLGLITPGTALMMNANRGADGDIFRLWGAGNCTVFMLLALFLAIREMSIYRRLEGEVGSLPAQVPSPIIAADEPA